MGRRWKRNDEVVVVDVTRAGINVFRGRLKDAPAVFPEQLERHLLRGEAATPERVEAMVTRGRELWRLDG